ncbi:MAG: glutamate racemase [Hydrogenoanaerobacterium sp.]
MNNKPIGVFDTGAGGLSLVRELRRLMPNENIIYLCDTARAPYGGHSKELIASNTMQGLEFLQEHEVKLLICASGTAAAVLPEASVKRLSVPYISGLMPCAQEACAVSVHGTIGVIGSAATVHSLAFGRAIRNIRTDARVIGKACPLLVTMSENGMTDPKDLLLKLAIKTYLEPLLREGIDALILGSSHYSVLFSAISEVFDYGVTLIDSAHVTAKYIESYLMQNNLQNDEAGGVSHWLVTDAPQSLAELSKIYYGEEIREAIKEVKLGN